MRSKRTLCRAAALLLAVLLTAGLCGCDIGRKVKNFPVEAGGVTVEAAPESVVSLTPYLGEIVYGLELSTLLVGRSSYCAFNGNVRALPDCGTALAPDVAAILATGAALVFTAQALPEAETAALTQAGVLICVLAVPTSIEQVRERVVQVAAVLKGNNRAEKVSAAYLDKFDTELAFVAEKLVGVSRPSGIFVLSEAGAVATGDTLQSIIMELAGIRNVAAAYTGYTMPAEALLAADPDLIIVSNPPSMDYIYESEPFSRLSAASAGLIYEIGNSYVECKTPAVTDLLYALAYAVHGEAMAAGADESAPAVSSVPVYSGEAQSSALSESSSDNN